MDYYCLSPISDKSLKIEVPTTNKKIREIISKERLQEIINSIPNIDLISSDEKNIEPEYKTLMNTGKHEDLIRIIKTTYLRNKDRLNHNKKIGDKDNNYFELAERYLYNEFSIVLGMDYEDTKQYVIDKVSEIDSIH